MLTFLFYPFITVESDQSVVGTVTSLQVQEAQGEDVRITWVGVQGATAYRVTWRRTDGGFTFVLYVHRMFFLLLLLLTGCNKPALFHFLFH